ncbi:MAG: 4-hydroxy-tetrahydrodipicolinate reductase [Clostridiales bacterium]|nr:4-hydroxy-tetrahydrodipicolinate reductase [Clostridiales bacterium]
MTRIILRGCNGRMGQAITQLLQSDDKAQIVAGIDVAGLKKNDYPVFKTFKDCDVDADVIIDFSSPDNLEEEFTYAKENNVPIVLCTTGLSDEQNQRVKEVSKDIAVLQSANMSIGINMLLKVLKLTSKALAESGYDIEIVEKHHNQKLDAPSGTALALADVINEVLNNDYHYVYDRSTQRQKRDKKEIGMSVVRGGSIVGEHEVIFAGIDEVIEFKHTAYSRNVFAKGAISAAIFLANQKPGLYNMEDVLG